jgi:hypothetical protein
MTDAISGPLASAIRGVLRPLIRILLRNGAPFGAFAECAREVYVEVAAKDFALPNRKASVSRVSVLTGLHRKEVSRLLKRTTDAEEESGAQKDRRGAERYHRGARVVSAWAREKRYRDTNGRPRTLAFEGRGATFSDLVRRYSGDMPPRAMLDELERVGAVKSTRDGRLRLMTRAFIPRSDEDEGLGVLESDAADLIASIDHNLTSPPEDAFIQRRVAYDNLVEESLPALRKRAANRGQALLEDFDRRMALGDRDANPRVKGSGRHRAVVGIYYYEHPVLEE